MSVVFAAIAPHGGIAVPEAVAPEAAAPAAAITGALRELGSRFRKTRPQTVVVFTPHNVHVDGHLAVIVAGRVGGGLEGSREAVALELETDRELALAHLQELRASGLPALGVSYGSNDPGSAVMPMDWAVLIPLWFMARSAASAPRLVVVSPARELGPQAHVEAGRALARAIAASGRRAAVVASADHGHAHRAEGPFGFDPAAAEYDRRVLEILRSGNLEALLEFEPGFVDSAKADSWWQMLMLLGTLGTPAKVDVLAYAAPTYFGMLCAQLEVPIAQGAL